MAERFIFPALAIPYDRDNSGFICKKHLGLYAYRRDTLELFAKLPPGLLEQTERLEQLRFLENGIDVFVEETPDNTIGVDTEDDLAAVEARFCCGEGILNLSYGKLLLGSGSNSSSSPSSSGNTVTCRSFSEPIIQSAAARLSMEWEKVVASTLHPAA